METLLTLTIAVSGIVTGIGAIWAAVVARRQAQVTERSLAQTERSLVEQNERSRLNLELDLLTRLEDRFESPHFLSRRRAAAKYLIDNVFVDGDMVEVSRLNRAVFDIPHARMAAPTRDIRGRHRRRAFHHDGVASACLRASPCAVLSAASRDEYVITSSGRLACRLSSSPGSATRS